MLSNTLHSLLLLFFLGMNAFAYGQYCESDTEPDRREVDSSVTSVKDYFLHGHISGHIRNYFMSTINSGSLEDHYANATGGSIAYSTASWKGIHFGVKGIFTYNLFSSQLAGNDSLGIRPSKWEQELFDLNHPTKTKDLDRLEELYVAYDHKHFHAKLGKIDIDKGPLLRRRDGRMKPFVFKGIWSEWKKSKGFKLFNGVLWGVSPRGMTEWYSFNEAIGILNNGQLNDSTELDYWEKTDSKGLLVTGIESEPGKHFHLAYWNYYLHNVHNTSWVQSEFRSSRIRIGMQYVFQLADKNQSLLLSENRYVHNTSHTVAGMFRFDLNDHLRFRIAQLFSLGEGAFLFPKEINRDNFYTSIQRSWMDGIGNARISLAGITYLPIPKKNETFEIELNIQYKNVSEFCDHLHNKYQSPDYTQVNLAAKYYFKKKLEGLHLNLLYTSRFSPNLPIEMTYDQQYYKTNLHHLNLVVDIVF